MANIIIPIEHQSAPRTPARLIQPFTTNAPKASQDEVMDLAAHDAKLQAEVAEFEKRVMDVSPTQTVEEALRQHEITYQKMNAYRWQGQERWQGKENEAMRMVRIMHPHTFIRNLVRAGIAASLDAEMPGELRNSRIWLNSFSRVGRVGVNAWVRGEAQTITTLQYPYGPEYSIMRFDEYNVPTNERFRGWRTALIELITKEVITEAEAERAFGPAIGPAGEFYREQLYNHRAKRLGIVTTERTA